MARPMSKRTRLATASNEEIQREARHMAARERSGMSARERGMAGTERPYDPRGQAGGRGMEPLTERGYGISRQRHKRRMTTSRPEKAQAGGGIEPKAARARASSRKASKRRTLQVLPDKVEVRGRTW